MAENKTYLFWIINYTFSVFLLWLLHLFLNYVDAPLDSYSPHFLKYDCLNLWPHPLTISDQIYPTNTSSNHLWPHIPIIFFFVSSFQFFLIILVFLFILFFFSLFYQALFLFFFLQMLTWIVSSGLHWMSSGSKFSQAVSTFLTILAPFSNFFFFYMLCTFWTRAIMAHHNFLSFATLSDVQFIFCYPRLLAVRLAISLCTSYF